MEFVEEFLIVEQSPNDGLAFYVCFFDLGLQIPRVRDVLALTPPSMLCFIKSVFLPIGHPFPHDSIDQTVEHAEDGDSPVVAGGEGMAFR